MGIRKLDWDNWIEMDSNYERYHDLKVAELEKDIDAHVQYYDDDVTKDACFEMLEELTRYLTHRYPRIFYLADGMLHNSVTGEKLRYPAGWFLYLLRKYEHRVELTGFQRAQKKHYLLPRDSFKMTLFLWSSVMVSGFYKSYNVV